MQFLEVIRGPDSGCSFPLDGDELTIGRGRLVEIFITDKLVSARHARLTRDGDGYVLVDLGSSNGTSVNDHPVKELSLKLGDEIRVGDSVLRYTDGPVQDGDATRAPTREQRQEVPEGAEADGDAPTPVERSTEPAARRERAKPKIYRIRIGNRLIQAPLRRRLVRKVICPNCWHAFPPDEVNFIAKRAIDESLVIEDQRRRFLPKRFSLDYKAVDPEGIEIKELACPRCRLQLPEAVLETDPLFTSIIGPPACGKSYFLTAMTWCLRQMMPRFHVIFTDTDPVGNSPIHDYEHTLFDSPEPEQLTQIRKTQAMDDALHRVSYIDGVRMRLPVPLQFTVRPTRHHPSAHEAGRVGRNVVLYDNAGEDFLPGAEQITSAAIEHLARSSVLLFVFDPTQERRLSPLYGVDDPQVAAGLAAGVRSPFRQETVLKGVDIRIRDYLRLPQDCLLRQPLVVVVAKWDVMSDVPGISIEDDPYVQAAASGPLAVDIERVERASDTIRDLLCNYCPDFVATAEGLSEVVRFIPVTSLGHSPVLAGGGTFYGVRPVDIRPKWITVPMLYFLSRWGPRGLVRGC